MGMYIEAEQCYRKGLAGSVEEFGGSHMETKQRGQKLADFLRDRELQGKAADDDV
jgi:hypothetical protein